MHKDAVSASTLSSAHRIFYPDNRWPFSEATRSRWPVVSMLNRKRLSGCNHEQKSGMKLSIETVLNQSAAEAFGTDG
jgi:hypothetical protein